MVVANAFDGIEKELEADHCLLSQPWWWRLDSTLKEGWGECNGGSEFPDGEESGDQGP